MISELDQMQKNVPYEITEWEWIKLKCEVYSARTKSETMFVEHLFREPGEGSLNLYRVPRSVEIVCKLHGAAIERLLTSGASREQQINLYTDWVAAEKQQMLNIISPLPVLSSEIDVNKHVAFVIMRSHSMSSFPVCTFIGTEVVWR